MRIALNSAVIRGTIPVTTDRARFVPRTPVSAAISRDWQIRLGFYWLKASSQPALGVRAGAPVSTRTLRILRNVGGSLDAVTAGPSPSPDGENQLAR